MSDAKFKEVEFKYNAQGMDLVEFKEFCKYRPNLKKKVIAFGPDHFYQKSGDVDSFCRHRVGGDINQLTFKRKTLDANNYIRTEHNLDLRPGITEEQVSALAGEFGYVYNTSIYKSCFVYTYDWYTLVYYICYDTTMEELGRFVELEVAEDYPWQNAKDAWDQLVALERICKPLGISPQSRLKRSLFELFRKESPK